MSTIYVVRHGQSEANVDPTLYARKPNESIELTELGKKQITEIRGFLLNDLKTSGTSEGPIVIFTSPFKRCIQSSDILGEGFEGINIFPNLLLSELNCGDQVGCEVEDFEQRPSEKFHRDMLGTWEYAPNRGESLIDVHVRAGLFITQNHFFQYCPVAIVVSHASVCRMMHYFLTNTCPEMTASWVVKYSQKAEEYWPNGLMEKYETPGLAMPFVHKETSHAKNV